MAQLKIRFGAGRSANVNGADELKHPLAISATLHLGLLVFAVLGTWLGHKDSWGEGSGTAGSATVRLVSSASVPLPSPSIATKNKVANEDPALHFPEVEKSQPKQVPENAIELPGRNAKKKPPKTPPKPVQEARLYKPDKEYPVNNEIPRGAGGPVAGPYGAFRADASTGGFDFAESAGDFGSRYGWYVTAIRNRISSNWLRATVDPNIRNAPRTFVTFQIFRDGQIANAQITNSSGIVSLDRSVLRAVLDSTPMPQLPPDYRGSNVTVEFWFDFKR